MIHPDQRLMKRAIQLAKDRYKEGGHAIAALVVCGEDVISEDITTVKRDFDTTCHAEMNALRQAMKVKHSRTLPECYLYTTFEPCPMCTSATIWAKMKGIIYGASRDDRTKEYPWKIYIPAQEVIDRSDSKLELYPEFMREECKKLFALV
jgi:tRNA(Arg) A34 adenosine deaminase TadA